MTASFSHLPGTQNTGNQTSPGSHKELSETLQEEQNIFLAMENELYAHDPSLAERLRERATPNITKKLRDIEKSAQDLESSLTELEVSYQEHLKMARESSDKSNEKVMIRLGKLEKMMRQTRQSLELNRTTRDDLMEWLLGKPLPAALSARS